MRKSVVALAVALPALACAATPYAAPEGAAAPECEIRMTEISGGARIESVVHGDPGTSGRYEFTLTRLGSGGTADVAQGGDYTIPEGGEITLAVSEFNHRPRDAFDAVLTVTGPDGSANCEKSEPSR